MLPRNVAQIKQLRIQETTQNHPFEGRMHHQLNNNP
jgi:hypothetical protein